MPKILQIYRNPNENNIRFYFEETPSKDFMEFFLLENAGEIVYAQTGVEFILPISIKSLEISMFMEEEFQAELKQSVLSLIESEAKSEEILEKLNNYHPIFPLKEHQWDAVRKILLHPAYALFHDPGLGKTKTILDMFVLRKEEEPNLKLFVVCPNFLVYNWREEVKIHTPQFSVITLRDGTKKKIENLSLDGDIYVTNVESIAPKSYGKAYSGRDGTEKIKKVKKQDFQEALLRKLQQYPFIGIIDESTTIKNPSAKTTRFLLKIKDFFKYRYILTGTPVPNNLMDIWSQLSFLNEMATGYDKFQNFKNNHFEFTGEYQQTLVRVKFEDVLYANISRWADIKKKEECYDLPEKIYKITFVDMPHKVKVSYKDLLKKCKAEFETLTQNNLTVEKKHTLSKAQVLMQVCKGFMFTKEFNGDFESPKLENHVHLLDCFKYDILYDILITEYATSKVIIWTTHIPERHILVNFLKHKKVSFECLFPEMKAEEVAERIKKFQAGNINILVCSLQSFNKGITLTVADVEIFFSNTYNWEMRAQAEDRTHRIGTVRSPVYHDIITKDSIEELIHRNLMKKGNFAEEFIKEVLSR